MMAPSPADRLRATLFGAGSPDPAMRISDADRAEVTDLLARHYGEGRLDQAEFDERVSRAMAAKTFGDFRGLFDDLPPLAGDAPSNTPGGSPRAAGTPSPASCHGLRLHQGRPLRAVLAAVLVIVAAIAWHTVAGWAWPGLWIVFLAAVFVMVSRNRRHQGG